MKSHGNRLKTEIEGAKQRCREHIGLGVMQFGSVFREKLNKVFKTVNLPGGFFM